MSVRHLLLVQTHDPARGSFYVNPQPVKKPNGGTKKVNGRPVYRGSMMRNRKGGFDPHPEAHEFVVMS